MDRRRFLRHIVPDGFVRIRHFGLLAQPPPPSIPPESARDLMLRVTGIDIARCLVCQQGLLRQLESLAPAPAAWDTS